MFSSKSYRTTIVGLTGGILAGIFMALGFPAEIIAGVNSMTLAIIGYMAKDSKAD